MKYLQNIHQHVENIDILLTKAFDLALKHEHLGDIEEKYNINKLQEQRARGRQKGRARDVSQMEQPAFVQRLSNGNKLSTNTHTPITSYTPSNGTPTSASPSNDNDNNNTNYEQDLNNMYKNKVEQEKNQKDKVPDIEPIDDLLNKKEIINEDDNDQEEEKNEHEGSHSADSYEDPSKSDTDVTQQQVQHPIAANGDDNDKNDAIQSNGQ